MAQANRDNANARRRVPSMRDLIARARERVELPDVAMRYDYQDDVDTLVILFEEEVNPSLLRGPLNDFEEGVIGIYKGRRLVGLEILDITGGLRYANPT
jgi:hypothetical protein